jgi:hypothetical protein
VTVSKWEKIRSALIVVGTAVLTSGCYTYVPAQFTTIPIGEGVRVYLSQSGVDRLRQIGADALPGLTDRPVLSGRLVRRDASEFSLQVPVGSRQTGFHTAALDQQVTLPVTDLVQVERRQVSGLRTALSLGAGTAALATVVVMIVKGARRPVDNTGPDPDNLRIPVFSIPVP